MTQNQFEFHTEWSDGHVHSAGFTTAWPPNKVILGRVTYPGINLDLNGKNEENGGPTFSAINARSFHPGGVNALLGDGSVKFIKSTIDGMTWRALTVGVCNQAYYWQLVSRGWTPDFGNNRAVLWTWERMIEQTVLTWEHK